METAPCETDAKLTAGLTVIVPAFNEERSIGETIPLVVPEAAAAGRIACVVIALRGVALLELLATPAPAGIVAA
jgi:hypothetical protein